jgi:hypothetical protein
MMRDQDEVVPVKPRWLQFLETTGGTALITVVVGGLMVQGATWIFQQRTAKREFAQTWLKARGDQALQGHTAYLQEQRQSIEGAYTLVGKMASSSDNLIVITTPAWDHPSRSDFNDMVRYRGEFNAAEDAWRAALEKLSFQFSYYSDGDACVGSAWRDVSTAVDAYRECASNWHDRADALKQQRLRWLRRHNTPLKTLPWFEVSTVCPDERKAVTQRMADLGRSLEATRTYAWRGWEDPDKLRQALADK